MRWRVWAFLMALAAGALADEPNKPAKIVLHNIGPVPTEDDVLDAWTILGHFRVKEAR